MDHGWEDRVAAFWESADDTRPERTLAAMRRLIDERPPHDAVALYEWASIHDFLGRERDAVSLYRAALDGGLSGDRRPQAVIQLASSLRNIGDPAAAVALLEDLPEDPGTGAAARAFLALALHDLGRHDDALRVALHALSPTLPRYRRAVQAYADALGSRG